MYGQIRTMLNSNRIKGNFCQTLWAEAANVENNTKNIMVNATTMIAHTKKLWYNTLLFQQPSSVLKKNRIAKNGNKIKGKIHNKGKICMMLKYASGNMAGTF